MAGRRKEGVGDVYMSNREFLEKMIPAINQIDNYCPVCIEDFCIEFNKLQLGVFLKFYDRDEGWGAEVVDKEPEDE